jgi:hypothetical protein
VCADTWIGVISTGTDAYSAAIEGPPGIDNKTTTSILERPCIATRTRNQEAERINPAAELRACALAYEYKDKEDGTHWHLLKPKLWLV